MHITSFLYHIILQIDTSKFHKINLFQSDVINIKYKVVYTFYIGFLIKYIDSFQLDHINYIFILRRGHLPAD